MQSSSEITLESAARTIWDVVVVGAGPAGAVAAREAARRGCRVLLVDRSRMPRFKVCGGCLNRRSLAALRQAGLGDLVGRLGAVPLRQMCWGAGGRRAELALPGGVSLLRSTLDAALVEHAVAAGAAFLPNVFARLGPLGNQWRTVHLSMDDVVVDVRTRLVLAADGLGSKLLTGEDGIGRNVRSGSRLGAGTVTHAPAPEYLPHVIYMACGNAGYVGAVRVEDGRLNLAAALDPTSVKNSGGLGQTVQSILEQARFPSIDGVAGFDWRGTPLLTSKPSNVATERVLAVGDCAGYVEPFTGEGIAWALTLGLAAGSIAERASRHWSPTAVAEWSQTCRRVVRRRQWVCRAMARSLRSPWLVRSTIALLSHAPSLAHPVVRWLNTEPCEK